MYLLKGIDYYIRVYINILFSFILIHVFTDSWWSISLDSEVSKLNIPNLVIG